MFPWPRNKGAKPVGVRGVCPLTWFCEHAHKERAREPGGSLMATRMPSTRSFRCALKCRKDHLYGQGHEEAGCLQGEAVPFRITEPLCLFQPHLLVWRTGPGTEEDKAEGRPVFHPDLSHRGCAQENAAHWFEYVHARRSGANLPGQISIQLRKSRVCSG